MPTATRTQRRYDHRLKEFVRSTGNIDLAVQSGVPRSTAYGWIGGTQTEVMSLDVHDQDVDELRRELVELRQKTTRLVVLLRLVVTVVKVTGFSLSYVRIPDERNKLRLLRAIEQTRGYFPLRTVLRGIGLTHGRNHAWTTEPCSLDDVESCPKSSPQQLTAAEVRTIREMATSDEFRHVPTGTLARLAERLGRVFASAST